MAIQRGCYMTGGRGNEAMVWYIRRYPNFVALTWSGYWLRPVPSGLLHLTIIYLQQMDMASPLASLCVNFGLGRIRNSIGEKATRSLHSPFTNPEVSAAFF